MGQDIGYTLMVPSPPSGATQPGTDVSQKFRLAVVTSHVITNRAPLYQRLAREPDIDLHVYYYSRRGLEPYYDALFGRTIQWDASLLEGYGHTFLNNWSRAAGFGFKAFINPGILCALWREPYDALLVHGHMYVTDWIALLGARLRGIPVLYRAESSLVYDQEIRRPFYLRVAKRLILGGLFRWGIAGFLSIGTLNREFYQNYGVDERRIFHVPYAVDNEYFSHETDQHRSQRNRLRDELGIEADDVVFLFAAKMTPHKSPMELLRAYLQSGPPANAALIMAGAGELKDSAQRFVEDHDIPKVIFPGFLDMSELPRFYAVSDVLVRPDGIYQGDWGLTVNEAMAAGLAIIASDRIGATIDLVGPGENGRVVRFGDEQDLADAFTELAARPDDVRRMGVCSRSRIANWGYEQDVTGFRRALDFIRKGYGRARRP